MEPQLGDRATAPDSGGADFFINVGDESPLDAAKDVPGNTTGYAVFGKVIAGMDVVDKINKVPTGGSVGPMPSEQTPLTPIALRSISIVPGSDSELRAEFDLLCERVGVTPQIAAEVDDMSPMDALKIGLVQCLAMIPGVSRSGATIMGARVFRVDRATAAEFSFFLAIANDPYLALMADITPERQRGRVGSVMAVFNMVGQVALLVVPETQVQQDQLEALVRPVQQEQMDLRDILSVATQQ